MIFLDERNLHAFNIFFLSNYYPVLPSMQHSGIPGLNNSNPNYIYQGNLRSAKATDQYICQGKGETFETWYPTLTYHGFRFVEINTTLAPNVVLGLESVHLLHFHSNILQRTNVTFKQAPTLNTIQTMALGAQRSNFMTVPTDCDQRDERLGWMVRLLLCLFFYYAVAFCTTLTDPRCFLNAGRRKFVR